MERAIGEGAQIIWQSVSCIEENAIPTTKTYGDILFQSSDSTNNLFYYTTKAVRGPITKFNQSDRSIVGPIFSKYWTGYCPE